MKEIGIKKLTAQAFAPYGSFVNMLKPEGYYFGQESVMFYRDMIQQKLSVGAEVSFSVCALNDRDWVIEYIESHDHTSEAIMSLDGDYLMHVAPATASDEEAFDQIEVFHIPKGTMVVTRPGVWHHVGFPYKSDAIHILVSLPQRTYAIDCHVVVIPEEKQIKVIEEII